MTYAEATRENLDPTKCGQCEGAGHTGQDRLSGQYDPCDACEGVGEVTPEAVNAAIRTGRVCGTCADEGALSCNCWAEYEEANR
jgi:DnaJ-class molecular chaperone